MFPKEHMFLLIFKAYKYAFFECMVTSRKAFEDIAERKLKNHKVGLYLLRMLKKATRAWRGNNDKDLTNR